MRFGTGLAEIPLKCQRDTDGWRRLRRTQDRYGGQYQKQRSGYFLHDASLVNRDYVDALR
jgi:hypothetical protein